MAIKSGNTAITIERLKDPLFAHLTNQFYDKMGELKITFLESETPAEPTRMEKLANWAKQTQTSLGELLVSPNGVWIGPKGFVKQGFKTNPKALQLSDIPIAQTLIAAVPVKTLVNAIELMGMKGDVQIYFPEKAGETLYFSNIRKDGEGNKCLCVKTQLIEAPSDAIASLPIQELLNETPIEVVKGETTLVEATPTIAEAIQQAVEENKIPQEMKESVQAAQTVIEEGFVEKAEIIEKMDTNIVPLDSGKRRKAQTLQQEIKETAKQLKTEMQKDDRDPNLIVKLIWRIETLGGRFIQITFALETHWWPTLTISEEVRKQAKEAYPQLAA